jgi:hypothetical protein
MLARDDTSEWFATAHDGPDSELARLHGDRPGFVFDPSCGTGLGTLMTKQLQKVTGWRAHSRRRIDGDRRRPQPSVTPDVPT